MSALDRLVDGALRDPLAAARARAQEGIRVVGYVGSEIPVELIEASHAHPLRLPALAGGGGGEADRYLESSFAPAIRSIAEQYLRRDLDFLHALILPRSDDSAQRLYYYLSELRVRRIVQGPELLMFDVAKIPRESSRRHTRAATERLAAQLGVDLPALPASIARRNRRRLLLASAAARRLRAAAPRGSDMERACRAADLCDADEFDAAFEEYLALPGPDDARARLLLIGSAPPDDRLHREVEASGGNIVAEIGDHASSSALPPLIDPQGSLTAVADHYQTLEAGTRAFVDRASLAGALARSSGASGAIVWLLEEEDALIWAVPAQTAALSAANVPLLALTRRRWDGADALGEIAAFTRRLEAST